MPVKKDPNGRRYVRAEAEVPGTPEEVWQAIASGPGVSSWFVPTTMDGRVGGSVTANFGPGMESLSTITAWDPPRRFSADSRDDMGPTGPTIATEWTVEARAGGTCLVRVVHSWFAESDDWDNQFEGHEQGWVAFFRILRVYLTHFRGQPSAALQQMAFSSASVAAAWEALTVPLGLAGAREGGRVTSLPDTPSLSGLVERAGPPEYPELLVRLDEPAPGIAHFFALPMGGSVCLPVRLYLYGARASEVVAREEPRWSEWLGARFPAADASQVAASES